MTRTFKVLLVFFVLSTRVYAQTAKELEINKISVMTIESDLDREFYYYFLNEYNRASINRSDAILIKISTLKNKEPFNGDIHTVSKILTIISESDLPTFIWISPKGVAKEGIILASGAAVLAMSSRAQMGLASAYYSSINVTLQGTGSRGGGVKVKIDFGTSTREAAKSRGRDPIFSQKLQKLIEEPLFYKAQDALDVKLIDFVANSEREFIEKINGMHIQIKDKKFQIKSNPQTRFVQRPFTFVQRLHGLLKAGDTFAWMLVWFLPMLIFMLLERAMTRKRRKFKG